MLPCHAQQAGPGIAASLVAEHAQQAEHAEQHATTAHKADAAHAVNVAVAADADVTAAWANQLAAVLDLNQDLEDKIVTLRQQNMTLRRCVGSGTAHGRVAICWVWVFKPDVHLTSGRKASCHTCTRSECMLHSAVSHDTQRTPQ